MAEPLGGGELVDPHGGQRDLALRLVRMVSERALEDDPLRSLRAVRIATEVGLEIDPATGEAAARHAPGIAKVANERVFAELKRVISAADVRRGLAVMEAYGLTQVVLPELVALRGIEQSRFHHADVYDHTLEVLDSVALLQRDPVAAGLDDEVRALLARAAVGRAHPRRRPALGRAPARRRQARDARVPRRTRDVHGPRRRRRAARPRRARAPEGVHAAARLRRRGHAAPPGRRLPRPRAAAGPADDLALPARHPALQRRHHDLHRRRPARHPRRQRRARDRSPPRSRARAARRRPRGGRRRAGRAAGPRRRARPRGRRPRGQAARHDPRPARGGPLRGRDRHPRGRAARARELAS